MFNFLTRDHVYGTIFGAALIGATVLLTGCGEKEACEDTSDTAAECTPTTTETTTNPTWTGHDYHDRNWNHWHDHWYRYRNYHR